MIEVCPFAWETKGKDHQHKCLLDAGHEVNGSGHWCRCGAHT